MFAAKTAGELAAQTSDLPDVPADTHPPATTERRPATSSPTSSSTSGAPAPQPVRSRETAVIRIRQALAVTLPLGGFAAAIGIVLATLTGPLNAGDYGELAAVVLSIAGGLLFASVILSGQLWALSRRKPSVQQVDQKTAGSR